jgi:hypothetical protein
MRRGVALAIFVGILEGCSSFDRPYYDTWGPQGSTSQTALSRPLPAYPGQARAWYGPPALAKAAPSTAGSFTAASSGAAGTQPLTASASADKLPGDVNAPWPGGPGIDAGASSPVNSVLGVRALAAAPAPVWPAEPDGENATAAVSTCGGETLSQKSEIQNPKFESEDPKVEIRDSKLENGTSKAVLEKIPDSKTEIRKSTETVGPSLPQAEPVAAHIVSVGDCPAEPAAVHMDWSDSVAVPYASDPKPTPPKVLLADPVIEEKGIKVPCDTPATPPPPHVALSCPMRLGTATVTTSNKASLSSPAEQGEGATDSGPAPVVRVVGSKRIHLQYELAGVGPSGIDQLELWCTRDGGHWVKHSIEHHTRPPYVLDVDEDDLYGFTLVAHSGAGVCSKPPRAGDPPQVWVEVDTTPPTVRLLDARIERDANGRQLTVLWKATDKNFGARPITISYASQPDRPWTPLAMHVENSGRCACPLSDALPHRFFLRVEAVDLAGNRATAQTRAPILDDAAQPTASIVTAEPGE